MSRSNQNNIERSLADIWTREQEFGDAGQGDAEAEHAFKIKNAKEFLAADGSVEARKATALLACEKEHLDYLKKKAIKEFTREKLRDAQDALSARQSLLSYEAKTNFAYTGQT